jgi:hypothetical protein
MSAATIGFKTDVHSTMDSLSEQDLLYVVGASARAFLG